MVRAPTLNVCINIKFELEWPVNDTDLSKNKVFINEVIMGTNGYAL